MVPDAPLTNESEGQMNPDAQFKYMKNTYQGQKVSSKNKTEDYIQLFYCPKLQNIYVCLPVCLSVYLSICNSTVKSLRKAFAN